MTFTVFNQIAGGLGIIFGNGFIIALIVIGLTIILMLIARAGRAALIMVLAPLIVTIAVIPTQFFQVPRWIAIVVWLVMGLIMAGVFWAIQR